MAGLNFAAETKYDTVIIPVKIKIHKIKGAIVPQINNDIFKYIKDVEFIYNSKKDSGIMLVEVERENLKTVKTIIEKNKEEIKDSEVDNLDKDFKGLKKALKDGFRKNIRTIINQ